MSARPDLIAAFETQIGWCERLGSSFMARLLGHALADLRDDGPVAGILGQWPGNPTDDALALRLAAALHALVLTGRDGDLAAHYPPNAAGPDFGTAIRGAVVRHDAFIRDWLTSPPQTNEVGRSGVLLGGFLEIARRFGKPLRLLEIGASAGLNLNWDRFRYQLRGADWGDPDSPVRLAPDWSGPLPPMDATITVMSRAGCDRRPVDLSSGAERLRLKAYVWADLTERMARLEGAMDLTKQARIIVDCADAADWLERELAEPAPGTVTVVYHTIVWQYLPAETKVRIQAAMHRYGTSAPMAWLRLELVPPEGCELTLTCWPGDGGEATERVLADAHPHGAKISRRA